MAGAVSAGAYTAGALDFLIEALDTWEAARGNDPAAPSHRVRLRAMSGASAGAMCAAILAALLHRRFPPARDTESRARNPLWQAWVEGPDIAKLLDPSDRGAEAGPVLSLLNVTALQQIVDGVLDAPGDGPPRAWVADALPISLSVGNLRGVPFGMKLGGGTGTQAHKMRMHADSAGFVLGDATLHPGLQPLAAPAGSRRDDWRALGQAALASGAFPVALRARALERPGTDYAKRALEIPGDGHPQSAYRDPQPGALLPDWPGGQPPARYAYLCVDGGVFDNEPLDLCRGHMMDVPGQRLVRDARFADRTVLMLDPFPDEPGEGPHAADTPLPALVTAIASAWKMQCRFGAVDVALAAAPDVVSRMMLVPSRSRDDEASGAPLAAGGLGAFLGFFHRDFRAHDFLLGRRNMQRFLQVHFALAETNPLFTTAAVRPAGSLVHPQVKPGFLPIVPLLGACATEEKLPDWPRDRLDPTSLAAPIRARLDAVVKDLLRDAPGGAMVRVPARLLWMIKRNAVVEDLVGRIRAALVDKKLARRA
jgi:hypothetical protein